MHGGTREEDRSLRERYAPLSARSSPSHYRQRDEESGRYSSSRLIRGHSHDVSPTRHDHHRQSAPPANLLVHSQQIVENPMFHDIYAPGYDQRSYHGRCTVAVMLVSGQDMTAVCCSIKTSRLALLLAANVRPPVPFPHSFHLATHAPSSTAHFPSLRPVQLQAAARQGPSFRSALRPAPPATNPSRRPAPPQLSACCGGCQRSWCPPPGLRRTASGPDCWAGPTASGQLTLKSRSMRPRRRQKVSNGGQWAGGGCSPVIQNL